MSGVGEGRDEARRLLTAATPGPWTVKVEHGRDITGEGWSHIEVDFGEQTAYEKPGAMLGDHENAIPDAEWIAYAHNHAAEWLAAADERDECARENAALWTKLDQHIDALAAARAETAEQAARIVHALTIIGNDGCYCETPDSEECTNHRIEAALRGRAALGSQELKGRNDGDS